MREVRTLSFLFALAACGGSSAADDDAGEAAAEDAGARADAEQPATFSEIYDAQFPATTAPRCNFCHSMPASDTSNGKLSMGATKDEAYRALVGVTSTSSHCAGMPLVTPGDPDNSLFYLKFTDPPPCGSRMPLGGAALDVAQRARVHSWISAGAKND